MNSKGKSIIVIIILVLILAGILLAVRDRKNTLENTSMTGEESTLVSGNIPEPTSSLDDFRNASLQEGNEEVAVASSGDADETNSSSSEDDISSYINIYNENEIQ